MTSVFNLAMASDEESTEEPSRRRPNEYRRDDSAVYVCLGYGIMYGTIASLTAGVAYLMARIGLVILIGYSFWSLPDGAYQEASYQWLQFLPFIH